MTHWHVFRFCEHDCQEGSETECLRKTKAQSLTEGNKPARFNCCRHLLRHYLALMVNFIWFTDEKLFTVKTPKECSKRLYLRTSGYSQKKMLSHLACCELDQTLAVHSWFLLVCLLLGEPQPQYILSI